MLILKQYAGGIKCDGFGKHVEISSLSETQFLLHLELEPISTISTKARGGKQYF